MKKILPMMIIILILSQLLLPIYSYAREEMGESVTKESQEETSEEVIASETEVQEPSKTKSSEEQETNQTGSSETQKSSESVTEQEQEKSELDVVRKQEKSELDLVQEQEKSELDSVKKQETNELDVVQSQEIKETNSLLTKELEELNVEDSIHMQKMVKSTNETVKIEEGIYKIVMVTAPNKSLTVYNGSKNGGANVCLWEYKAYDYQKFQIRYDSDGFCEIIPVHSNQRLDMEGWGNGTNVAQWQDNSKSDSQRWIIKKSAKGNYNIVSKRENRYLNVYQSNTANGTNIQVYEQNGENGQEFKLEKIGEAPKRTIEEGIYKITMATAPNQSLTVYNGSKNGGANVCLWQYEFSDSQKFQIKYDSNDYCEIIPIHSNQRLDMEGWGNGTNVAQWADNGGNDSQRWIIKKSAKGNYNIISKRENRYLNAYQSKTSNVTNIQVYDQDGGNGQEFKLERIDNKKDVPQRTVEEGIYKITMATAPNQSLTVYNGSKDGGANVCLWQYAYSNSQKFQIKYDSEDYCEIIPIHSNQRLDMEGWGNGTNVAQWYENSKSDSQKWIIKKSAKGNYNIVSKRENRYLYAGQSNTANGTNIQVFEENGKDGQEFILERVDRPQEKPERTVEEGVYKITMATAPNQSLTVYNGSKNGGANVCLWKYANSDSQKFKIVYDSEDYCEIIPIHSNQRLDMEGWGNGTNVAQWGDNGGNDSQRWIIKKSEKGNYNIISKRENRYLEAYKSNTANGTNIQVFEKTGVDGQEFKLERVDDLPQKTIENGTYKIVMATAPSKSLTVHNGNKDGGANICLGEYANVMYQQFNIVYDGNGYYEIIPINSGKRLDMAGWGNNTNVEQWSNNGQDDSQKWIIKKSAKGNYNIISKREGRYLNASSSKMENGTNINVYEKNNGNGQEFKLEKIGNKSENILESRGYKIVPQSNTKMAFEIQGGYKDNNSRLQVWEDFSAKWQKVNLEYKDGYYRISFGHSNKYLTVKNGKIASGSELVQYDWNGGENQKWIIRDNGNGSLAILPLSDANLAITIKDYIKDGSIVQLEKNVRNERQNLCFIEANLGVNIDTKKYPGVAEAIDKLVEKHPNWEFEILYTTLDFNTAVRFEYEYAGKQGNLVDTSIYKGGWIAPEPYVSGIWASASYQGIGYFMDTRNFLNEINVFQFLDLGNYQSSGATLSSIQQRVNGTFLQNFANDIMQSCKNTNINPYYIIARLIQEQGTQGSITIYMDGGDGKQYFNPFNIGAQVGNDFETGLARAKKEGWDTMQKGIEGGIKVIKSRYIDKKQNTLYLNKFDVNPASDNSFYSNQYMQNVSASYSEALNLRNSYVSTGTLDNQIKFIVPVYENMPTEFMAQPTGGGEQSIDKGPISVKVIDTQMGLALRDAPSSSGNLIKRLPEGTILLSVRRIAGGWHEVITLSGEKGFCSNSNLEIIDDDKNCNDRVIVTTVSKVGAKVRIGPGSNYDMIKAVPENSIGTRIVTNRYKDDQYWWDEVIFDDGTKGFVATDFLRKMN